ncbi:MAG: cytochrome c [Alphaproteobacteria bacterium]|nr:cytochrome c [Alphaproteobacteria bacterium]
MVVALALLAMTACGGGSSPQPATGGTEGDGGPTATAPAEPAAARSGEDLFNANCSACHGVGAVGTDAGPPLVHDIYHPGHHSDVSIRSAVQVGVMQHHWFFGDMPPVAGVPQEDVEKIVCYIRETQRAGGIFAGDAFNTVC